jgi:glycerate dehydrogenase
VLVAERRGVAAAQVRPGREPFEAVLERSEVLSLHCPLDASTRGLIGEAELSRMRRSAILINTARGGLVDELALTRAIEEQRIGGAGIDVLSAEPPRGPNPLLALAERCPRLIVTPHIGWSSREAMQALADQLVDNLEAFAEGKPRNLVGSAPSH